MADQYLVMWCNDGLEAVINLTELEQEDLVYILKTGNSSRSKAGYYITMMSMRARTNSQRHYEIYGLTVSEGITEADVRGMFDDSPQTAADTIRRIGVKVYSDRNENKKLVIT